MLSTVCWKFRWLGVVLIGDEQALLDGADVLGVRVVRERRGEQAREQGESGQRDEWLPSR
jgi:hypothetical protein